MSWKDSLPFLTPKFITHEVNGESLNFYPVSIGLLFKLRALAEPLARTLSSLFVDKKRDYGIIERHIANNQGTQDGESIIEAVTPELAKLRADQQERAISDLIKTFTDETTLCLLAEIIIDSLRETFPKNSQNTPPPKELVAATPTPIFMQMVLGAVRGNKGLIDPLLALFPKLPETLIKRVNSRLTLENPQETDQENPQETDQES